MRRSICLVALACIVVLGAAGGWVLLSRSRAAVVDGAAGIARPPRIFPDYAGATIPPNIAPLNFVIHEKGNRYLVRIGSTAGVPVEIFSRSPVIRIPQQQWHALIGANIGGTIQLEVYTETDGRWQKYEPFVNHVARQPIDEYLVYRVTGPVHEWWSRITVQQRNLTNCRNRLVLDGDLLETGCVNCHSFAANRPDPMLIGVRSERFGNSAILAHNGEVKRIATPFGYTAWHPTGRVAACSINKVRQFFHAAGPEVRDVIDLDAALAWYRVGSGVINLVPKASDKSHLESYPTWSPEGNYLYYCSAPILWTDRNTVPPPQFADVRYDLMRICYDIDADTWGEPELVLSAEQTGLSILEPRISPDGKFLLFCMCRYGCFPVYQPTSDLYMMNLESSKYEKLEINSPQSESWHSWSSNSRWIAFSSRRCGGVFTRCFLSYVDETGKAHQPFMLPQDDPEMSESLLRSISVPELITAPVPVAQDRLVRCVRSAGSVSVDAVTGPSPLAGSSEPWRRGRP